MPGEPARWTPEQLDAYMAQFNGGFKSAVTAEPVALKRSSMPRAPKMNKAESQYEVLLKGLVASRAITGYGFEAITLKLAEGCRYTPDFAVFRGGSVQFHEVKGRTRSVFIKKKNSTIIKPHLEDDARVKLLTAARLFPFAEFYLCWLDTGKWQMEQIAGSL